jgi:hypothetical protein
MSRADAKVMAWDIIEHVIGEAYVPMHAKKLRPLNDSELGKLARTLIPKLASTLLEFMDEPR